MFILVAQSNRAIGAFETQSRMRISATDEKRADAIAKQSAVAKTGYYDVLLCTGTCSAARFSDYALAVPRAVYNNARDSVIGVK